MNTVRAVFVAMFLLQAWASTGLAAEEIDVDAQLQIVRGISPQDPKWSDALEALGKARDPKPVWPLLGMLQKAAEKDDRPQAIALIEALGQIADSQATSPLLELVFWADASIAKAVLSALRNFHHGDDVAVLITALQERPEIKEDPDLRIAMADVLYAMVQGKLTPEITAHLDEGKDDVLRAHWMERFAADGADGLRPMLTKILDPDRFHSEYDKRVSLAKQQRRWQRDYDEQKDPYNAAQWERLRVVALRALVALDGKEALEHVLMSVGDPQDSVGATAVELIPQIAEPAAAVEFLQHVLDGDATQSALIAAAKTLGTMARDPRTNELATGQAIEILVGALSHAKAVMRSQAAMTLAESGARQAIGPIAELLRDRDRGVRGHAREALGRLGVDGILAIVRSQHFPKGLREGTIGYLRRHYPALGLVEEDVEELTRLIEGPGLSGYITVTEGESKEHQTPPEYLLAVELSLRTIAGEREDLTEEKLRRLMDDHDWLHARLGQEPRVVAAVQKALEEKLSGEKLNAMQNGFELNYVSHGDRRRFVEELIVTLLMERLVFDSPVELLPPEVAGDWTWEQIQEAKTPIDPSLEKALLETLGDFHDSARRKLRE